MNLTGSTIIMSGGSRGIGLAIAKRAARDGANIAILAKTDQPHPKLPGTIFTAAEEIEAAGGHALPLVGDIRDDEFVDDAVQKTVDSFGGIDIVVNNASAIDLSRTEDVSMKKYDLMLDINARGAFLLSKTALPYLKQGNNPHILTLSPPIRLEREHLQPFTAYTVSKFAMSVVSLNLSVELADAGIASNSLWPRTMIDTAAVRNVIGGETLSHSRTDEIMADAAYVILTKPARESTGNFFIDEEVLRGEGVTDFSKYLVDGTEEELANDFWV